MDASYTGSLYRGEVCDWPYLVLIHSLHSALLALLSAYSLTAQVALHIAAVKNNHRIARMLIAARASVNRPFANGDFFKSKTLHYGGTILGFACVNSDFELFEMVMEAGVLICALVFVLICALVGLTQQSSELLDMYISLALGLSACSTVWLNLC